MGGIALYWFWMVLFYSFAGYLLEKVFAYAVGSVHRVRKCCLLLPLCPVYGFAMLAVVEVTKGWTDSFWWQAACGGVVATAVEYLVHFLYEKLLGVMFWDYSDTHLDLHRRICYPFSIAWGLLSALAVWYVQPLLPSLIAAIPAQVTVAAMLLVVLDGFFTIRLLLRFHDIDLLGLPNLWRALRSE